MAHVKKELHIIHTYGLGDSIMLLNSLDALSNEDKHNVSVLTNERVVCEYMMIKNVDVHYLSLVKIVKYIILTKISKNNLSVMRSFGGTGLKNYLIGLFFKLFNINYEWKVTDSVEPIPFSVRSSKNTALLKRFFNIVDTPPRCKEFPVFLGLNPNRKQFKSSNPCNVLIHFGAGDSLKKSLNDKIKKNIVDYYENSKAVNRIFLLKGPRDENIAIEPSSKITLLGNKTPFSLRELIELAKNVDICACNDTGIGHLMAYEGAKIDLWINGDSGSLIHQVLPNNISSLTIV